MKDGLLSDPREGEGVKKTKLKVIYLKQKAVGKL